jgi:hypothetical protein
VIDMMRAYSCRRCAHWAAGSASRTVILEV